MESRRRERDISPDEAAALWLAAIVLAIAPVGKITIGKLSQSNQSKSKQIDDRRRHLSAYSGIMLETKGD